MTHKIIEYKEFYLDRFPALQGGEWVCTASDLLGSVWARSEVADMVVKFGEEVVGVSVSVGLFVGNNWSKFFVAIGSVAYPDPGAAIDLRLDTRTADWETLTSEALRVARDSVESRIPEIAKQHRAWLATL